MNDASGPRLFVPPGHFYSPVVDPAELARDGFAERRARDGLLALDLDFERMAGLFHRLMAHVPRIDFPTHRQAGRRFYFENDMYSYGDAIILAAMVREFRPARYVEVGSGFSSAVVLDTLDAMPGASTACTFIEPHTGRLDALLTEADATRVRIIRQGVQQVPLSLFEALAPGDVLFLDTTHVVKTGSDVVHEVLQILPRLASGVIVHFHDVFADFEYPEPWIMGENRSWNEQYLLRAFLMYNNAFEVLYANHAFYVAQQPMVAELCPLIARNCGGGLWLRKR